MLDFHISALASIVWALVSSQTLIGEAEKALHGIRCEKSQGYSLGTKSSTLETVE